MSNFWARDPRLANDEALRDLEKKVHFLMSIVCNAELTSVGADYVVSTPEIDADAIEVLYQGPKC